MTKSLDDKLNELPAARRKRILADAEHLHAEYLTLQELRKAKKLTQAQLAEALNIRQATIAQMEKRSDLLLSTLRSYVEAMGGKLNITVEFPDRMPVSIEGFGDAGGEPLAIAEP
ncbi:MAG: helix-turn-helix transcriptional regulator [Cellvibrionales bacterium]|nr:helix-turn-helix transcriptional regulator [Cellvibrionales bacterium]